MGCKMIIESQGELGRGPLRTVAPFLFSLRRFFLAGKGLGGVRQITG